MLEAARASAALQILYLPHAIRQMARPDRMITPAEVEHVVKTGEIVEEYPDDPRGASCLILGHGENQRAIHVVCAPKPEYLAVITAYLPDPEQWEANFRRRRQP